jgi:hypothetical protein
VAFYGLARVLLSRAGALVATLVLAASASHVYFAQEVRHYALAAFFVTLSWYLLVQLVAGRRLERWHMWLGLALANTCAVYTFYYTLFSVAAQLVVLLLLWRSIGRKLVPPWLSWQLLPAALFACYVPVILERLADLRGKAPPASHTVLSVEGLSATAAQFCCGPIAALTELLGGPCALVAAAAAALGLLALAAGLTGLRGHRTAAVVGLTWLLGPVAFLAALPIRGHTYEPKHLMFASPAIALLLGTALDAGQHELRKYLVVGLIGLIVATNVVALVCYYDRTVEKENWRDLVRELVGRVEPSDIVVFNPPWVEFPFHYYYSGYFRERPVDIVPAPLAGKAFRAGELKRERRVWVLEAVSNVAIPNPEVTRALRPYPLLFSTRYEGLLGRIRLLLFDTVRAQAAGPSASR